MRIAIVAPPWLPIPPGAYGGTETVLDTLASGLKAAGHDVLLCTTGESTCDVERTWVFDRAVGVGNGGAVSEIRHVIHSYEHALDADIIHDHTLVGPLYAASHPEVAMVTTNHGPFSEDLIDFYQAISPRVPIIAISHHQARTAKSIPIAATIHHGVNLNKFPIGTGAGGYAAFLGRMHPGKGVDLAARVARKVGYPLHIAGKMSEPAEIEYFESKVRPLLGGNIDYVGELNFADKTQLLGNATCLLNPIVWPEPFGMVMIESLACGTPVVTTHYGAAPEIVEDGVVGFVRSDEIQLADALTRVHTLDRSKCRALVSEKFSSEKMVDRHVALYESVLTKRRSSLFDIASPAA